MPPIEIAILNFKTLIVPHFESVTYMGAYSSSARPNGTAWSWLSPSSSSSATTSRYASEGSGSGSTAVAVRSSGHHVFEIRDYSILKAITPQHQVRQVRLVNAEERVRPLPSLAVGVREVLGERGGENADERWWGRGDGERWVRKWREGDE